MRTKDKQLSPIISEVLFDGEVLWIHVKRASMTFGSWFFAPRQNRYIVREIPTWTVFSHPPARTKQCWVTVAKCQSYSHGSSLCGNLCSSGPAGTIIAGRNCSRQMPWWRVTPWHGAKWSCSTLIPGARLPMYLRHLFRCHPKNEMFSFVFKNKENCGASKFWCATGILGVWRADSKTNWASAHAFTFLTRLFWRRMQFWRLIKFADPCVQSTLKWACTHDTKLSLDVNTRKLNFENRRARRLPTFSMWVREQDQPWNAFRGAGHEYWKSRLVLPPLRYNQICRSLFCCFVLYFCGGAQGWGRNNIRWRQTCRIVVGLISSNMIKQSLKKCNLIQAHFWWVANAYIWILWFPVWLSFQF